MKEITIFEQYDVVSYIGEANAKVKYTDIGIVRGITVLENSDDIAILVDFTSDKEICMIANPKDLVYLGRLKR